MTDARNERLVWIDLEMTGLDPANVLEGVASTMRMFDSTGYDLPTDYAVTNCSKRVVKFRVAKAAKDAILGAK